MRTVLISVLTAMMSIGAAMTTAQADDRPFTNPGPDAATIVGSIGRPAQEIYPVEFIELDGRNINARDVLWLKPGKYELRVRGFVHNRFGLRSVRDDIGDSDHNRIELVVEAGKTYHIGLKHDRRARRSPYNTVLFRVEEE